MIGYATGRDDLTADQPAFLYEDGVQQQGGRLAEDFDLSGGYDQHRGG